MIVAASFAGIMAIIGWCLVATFLILFGGLCTDFMSALTQIWGGGGSEANWGVIKCVIIFIWVVSFGLYFLL